jgi:hypothetical protein
MIKWLVLGIVISLATTYIIGCVFRLAGPGDLRREINMLARIFGCDSGAVQYAVTNARGKVRDPASWTLINGKVLQWCQASFDGEPVDIATIANRACLAAFVSDYDLRTFNHIYLYRSAEINDTNRLNAESILSDGSMIKNALNA